MGCWAFLASALPTKPYPHPSLLQKVFYFYFFICVCPCVCAGAHRDPKRVSYPLELELQEVVSSLMWKLGTKLSGPLQSSKCS